MANTHILIDTTIFVDHLRKQNKRNSILYRLSGTSVLYTATMVEFELFAGATNQRKYQDVQQILQPCHVLSLTSPIAQRAGTIYQDLKRQNLIIEIRDMLIAATALEEGLPLMTINEKHFRRIQGINLLPPP
jgi:predicted nucleic acid-binding protein